MKPVSPSWKLSVVVCCNQRTGRPCCGSDGETLRDRVRDWARNEGLRKHLVVHRGQCMDHCGAGVTVALHLPNDRRIVEVDPDDIPALCEEIRRMVMV